MLREDAKNIHEKVLKVNDPEAWERISHFAFEEVQDDVDLPNKTKLLSNFFFFFIFLHPVSFASANDCGV